MKTQIQLRLLGLCCALAVLFAGPSAARATQCVQSGNWSNPATWGGGLPGGSAELIDCTVFLDIPVTIANVTLGGTGNGGTLSNTGGNNLTVTNRLELSRGDISGGSPLAVVIPSTATLVFSGPSASLKFIGGNTTIHNAGQIEWTGGAVNFNGTLNNSGTFVISGDAGFGHPLRTGVINNTGSIVKESGNGVTQFSGFTPESSSIATAINNQGVVEVASGTIEMGRGTSNGEFSVGADKTLLISDGHTFDEATFTGAGTCSLAGTMTFLGHINSTADLELVAPNGRILGGDATHPEAFLEGSGRLLWKGGKITGPFTLGDEVRTVLTGPDRKDYDGAVTNKGTMDWFGPGALAGNNTTFRNEGTFNVLAPGTFLADTFINLPTFENIGTLNTAPDGTSEVSDTLIRNSGLVNIGGFGHAGVLQVNSYEQTATGLLHMEIGGANAGTPQFDQLTGSSIVDGTLLVDVINNYTPPQDARFVLMNNRTGEFSRAFTPGGTERSRIEYPSSRCELVSLSNAPIPLRLWGAGRDLARNESPDRPAEAEPINETVPQWSYGYRTTAASTALTLFTPPQHINDASGLHGWIAPGQATLAVNTRATPLVFNTGSGDYKPLQSNQIYLSPGSSNEFLVVRWTAPAAGDFRVGAKWFDIDPHGGNGASAHLVINGTEQFVEQWDNGGKARLRARTFTLAAGDFVDFVLGSRGENLFDATAFNGAVRRVPHVEITSPASGSEFPAGTDVTVQVATDNAVPVVSVALRIDNQTVESINTPPYHFVRRLEPGVHVLKAIATDSLGAKRTSPKIEVTVTGSSTAASATRNPTSGNPSASTPDGTTNTYIWSAQSGAWNDPANWTPNGVPGFNDVAIIPENSAVTLTDNRAIKHLAIGSNSVLSTVGDATNHPILTVFKDLNQFGQIRGPIDLILAEGAYFANYDNTAEWVDVNFTNNGNLNIEGGLASQRSTLTNQGSLQLTTEPGTAELVPVQLLALFVEGGLAYIQAQTQMETESTNINGGTVQLGEGGTPIGLEGGTLIGVDGDPPVQVDNGTLMGFDGRLLLGNDGTPLIGLDAGALTADGGEPRPAGSGAGITLTGGVIIGTGELRGDVVNQGGFIVPGGNSAAGGILIRGDYTQEGGGKLVLEEGGTTSNPLLYDIFQVAGTANLGGNLIVRTISGYVPAPSDAITPLLYASHTGSFANVSSNAQISYGATGAQVTVTGPNPPAPKALNIATRMRVEMGDNVLIAGFIITGSQPKRVIIRGIGPSLPLAGVLANPTLNLDNGAVTNDDWRTGGQEAEIIATTIPPSNDLESAIVATLNPGPHTAILSGSGGTTGIGVVEVYDLDPGTPAQLANISTRGLVQTGDDVMIGGFIIGGTYPATVIVRAIGPSLPFAGTLENPSLELVDQNGGRISNDDWRATQEAEIIASTIPPSNDNEAAVVATLAPGSYTAIVRGQEDTTGLALVEVYTLE